ncbi:MAG: DegT/DnrJ/EryC1/StrS family aminotransferase [Nitrososphaerota archaeon]|nr:DegT/DnrJ/EryC1/StrS family aminotransferase [Nitrososphaerota archaeon]
MERIAVCEPLLAGNELKYVEDALRTGWISSSGKYVEAFQEQFADYCGVKYGVAVCNGTAALHVALLALGIGKGDEVIIPDFTMIASAFAVCYTGAIPVFVDVNRDTWTIDIEKIEDKITSRTKAIMPVSIFGHPCEMDELREITNRHGLRLIEDAAESHGADYKGKRLGSIADVTAFSFYANKNITTGEGGMVVTNDRVLRDRCLYYKNLCFPIDGSRTYYHEELGFNYRMSNLHAAIGLAQVEKADQYKEMRIRNGHLYEKYFGGIPGLTLQKTKNYVTNVHWMNGVVLNPEEYGKTRAQLMGFLGSNGVDTRVFFVGMHKQPSLLKCGGSATGEFPITDWLAENGFYLPSSSNLSEQKIRYICDLIRHYRGA